MRYLMIMFLILSLHADSLKLEAVFPKKTFERPIGFLEADAPGEWYVVEQRGKVWHCRGAQKKSLVMDLSKRLGTSNEEGLLCLVKSPNYQTDKHVYIYYSNKRPRKSIISRFILDNNKINLSSEEIVLEIPEPYANHNGGQLAFGADRMLYVGVGDGGAAGDPKLYGQDLTNLHGSILRLDVLGHKKYKIPTDNPLVNEGGGVRAEIFAWGLRNPWRFSFDSKTNELWCGDVGQNKFEEVNIINSGGNYGWNIREGREAYIFVKRNKKKKGQVSRKDTSSQKVVGSFIDPIFIYPRKDGLSITGGYVYQGNSVPHLKGWYLCSDFVSGAHWLLKKGSDGIKQSIKIKENNLQVASYAQDSYGELYMMSFKDGTIYKILDWIK